MSTLELNAIDKSYGPLRVAEKIDLSVEAGSRTAIVGPSGSGKTTLLRMIAGFEFPDRGRISLDGKVLFDGPAAVPAHQRRIGYVPQDGALFPHMSIAANIGFGLSDNNAGKPQRVAELMELVELDARMLKSWPHELSGGQQQRVALARALAQRPTLMLLDEPFSALDTGLRTSIRKVVEQVLAETGVTSILVTHDQAEALSFADQLAVMRRGKLVQVGRPRDLYLHPNDEEAARFLGDAIIVPARLESGWANCELGQIPILDCTRTGNVQIMLRPEQLQLRDTVTHEKGSDGCLATVTESDFGGHVSLLTLQLPSAPLDMHHEARVIQVRSLSIHAPKVGSTVFLSVMGHAHVL